MKSSVLPHGGAQQHVIWCLAVRPSMLSEGMKSEAPLQSVPGCSYWAGSCQGLEWCQLSDWNTRLSAPCVLVQQQGGSLPRPGHVG